MQKKRKIKKFLMGFLIAVVLANITFITLMFVVMYLFLFGGPAKVTRDIDNYAEIVAGNTNVHTAYIVFPEAILESATDIEFYNYYRDTFNIPMAQTYLQCTYSPEDYKREIDRLENVRKTYGNRIETLKRDKEGKFDFPAYVAVDNADYTYEYALITGENRITYIFTECVESDKIRFDEKYLPDDFMTDDNRGFGSGYSIYYSSVSSSMILNDYTRDPVTVVTGAHMRYIGQDGETFYVRYRLDDDGREIITECVFFDSDLNEEDYELSEVEGMEFVGMESDYDSDSLILKCRENGEIREFVISLSDLNT